MISPASRTLQRRALDAHGVLGSGRPEAPPAALSGLRPVVRDSWLRSLGFLPDPDRAAPQQGLGAGELAYRAAHPLAVALPVLERLLVDPTRDTGLITGVGDEDGRLLWVEGDAAARRRAERWRSAGGRLVRTGRRHLRPRDGTRHRHGRPDQRGRALQPHAHSWSCSAVPLRDPATGRSDRGGRPDRRTEDASPPTACPCCRRPLPPPRPKCDTCCGRRRPDRPNAPGQRATAPSGRRSSGPLRAAAVGSCAARGHTRRRGRERRQMGLRHAEILTLLAWNPARPGQRGSWPERLYRAPGARSGTLRPEMVRLRRAWPRRGSRAGPAVPSLPPGRRIGPGCARRAGRWWGRGGTPRRWRPTPGRCCRARWRPGSRNCARRSAAGCAKPCCRTPARGALGTSRCRRPSRRRGLAGTALRILPARSPRRSVLVARLERLEAESANPRSPISSPKSEYASPLGSPCARY